MFEMKLEVHSELAAAIDAETSDHVIVNFTKENVLEILALQKIVKEAKLYQVEKFNESFHTEWHEYVDTDEGEEPKLSNIELETILVCDDDFYFQSTYRGSSYYMETSRIQIADLVAAFNLEEMPEPVAPVTRLVIEIKDGLFLNVVSDQPAEYVVYDYSSEYAAERQPLPAVGNIEDNVVDVAVSYGYETDVRASQVAKVYEAIDAIIQYYVMDGEGRELDMVSDKAKAFRIKLQAEKEGRSGVFILDSNGQRITE